MPEIPKDIEGLLRTVAQLYALQNKRDEVEILAKSKAEVLTTSSDNWNGGTYGYTIVLRIPMVLFVKISDKKSDIESDIIRRLNPLLTGYFNQSIDALEINVEIENNSNWRTNAVKWLENPNGNKSKNDKFDIFISHASEDKESLVRPLAVSLKGKGYKVWYDEYELKIGDSLSRNIDLGLSQSSYGLVVLSPSFFSKNWPRYELEGLISRQMVGKKVILPLWHKVTRDDILKFSPNLADKLALNSSTASVAEMVAEISKVLGK